MKWLLSNIDKTNQDYSLFQRLTATVESGEDAGRRELNREAIQIFKDKPLLGVGVQRFQNEMILRFNEERTVHNLYLYILAVSGIVGLICFGLFLFHLSKDSYAIRKGTSLAITLLIYVFFLAYKTGGALTYMLMWYVFGVIISLYKIHSSRSY